MNKSWKKGDLMAAAVVAIEKEISRTAAQLPTLPEGTCVRTSPVRHSILPKGWKLEYTGNRVRNIED